jgi:hypothetical protein
VAPHRQPEQDRAVDRLGQAADELTFTDAGLVVFALRMALFQNRTLLTLTALLALLVFSGDVLDDVWTVPGSTAPASQNSDQQSGGSTKAQSTNHDDTVIINTPSGAPAMPLLCVFECLDADQRAPVGAVRSIDHPPQLS